MSDNSTIENKLVEKDITTTTNVVDSPTLGGPNVFGDRLLRLLFENKDEFLAEAPLPYASSHSSRSNRTFAIERPLFDNALQSIREEDNENCSIESKNEQQQKKQVHQPQQRLVPVYSH